MTWVLCRFSLQIRRKLADHRGRLFEAVNVGKVPFIVYGGIADSQCCASLREQRRDSANHIHVSVQGELFYFFGENSLYTPQVVPLSVFKEHNWMPHVCLC